MNLRKRATEMTHKQFPPEAADKFDVVPEADIVAWRERLNAQYGIGAGKLVVIDDPAAA